MLSRIEWPNFDQSVPARHPRRSSAHIRPLEAGPSLLAMGQLGRREGPHAGRTRPESGRCEEVTQLELEFSVMPDSIRFEQRDKCTGRQAHSMVGGSTMTPTILANDKYTMASIGLCDRR